MRSKDGVTHIVSVAHLCMCLILNASSLRWCRACLDSVCSCLLAWRGLWLKVASPLFHNRATMSCGAPRLGFAGFVAAAPLRRRHALVCLRPKGAVAIQSWADRPGFAPKLMRRWVQRASAGEAGASCRRGGFGVVHPQVWTTILRQSLAPACEHSCAHMLACTDPPTLRACVDLSLRRACGALGLCTGILPMSGPKRRTHVLAGWPCGYLRKHGFRL